MANNFLYHILKSTCPDSILTSNGYPAKSECNHSQGGSWIIFDGKKTTPLESEFDLYLPDMPYPTYWNNKAINLTQSEARSIVLTSGTDETLGWWDGQLS